ncbi:hypothetical protein GCM10009628_13330 [Paeniglutamicibacter kerguelensis]
MEFCPIEDLAVLPRSSKTPRMHAHHWKLEKPDASKFGARAAWSVKLCADKRNAWPISTCSDVELN